MSETNEVEIFKPGIAELKKLAERLKGLDITGIDDEAGYLAVKEGQKELADMRILVTKAGKQFREKALLYQREVIRQEKEHLEIIVPLENELKAKRLAVDEAKKKKEREILLPGRRKLLEDIKVPMTDDEILSLDEEAFSRVYTDKKMAFDAEEARKREAIEAEKRHAKELAEAKKNAVAEEKRKQAERDARAKADAERKEAERIAQENAEKERTEKNRRYKAWLKKHGIENGHDDTELKIDREGDTFTLWRKVDEITIK